MIVSTMVIRTDVSDEELIARATRAWYMAARAKGYRPDAPANDSGVEEHGGKSYVVLKNVRGPLAVYRVRNDGMLKALKRWPKALEPVKKSSLQAEIPRPEDRGTGA